VDDFMRTGIIAPIAHRVWLHIRAIKRRVVAWTRSVSPGVLAGAVVDTTRPKAELVAENASLFAFVIIEHASRRVVHVGVTGHPTDAWVAQQLREATPFGAGPRYSIRDNDATYGAQFARIAPGSRIEVPRMPMQVPRANALCERFLGSVRRACINHLIILHEAHLRRVLAAYVAYFNRARPHQGIGQRRPQPGIAADVTPRDADGSVTMPVLGGLHHDYHRAA